MWVHSFLLHILAGLVALATANAAVLPEADFSVSQLDARALSSVQMTFVAPGTPFDGYVVEFVWPYGTIWLNRTASTQYAYVDYSLTDSGVLTGHGTKLCLRPADNARSSYFVVDPTIFTPRTDCTGDDLSWGIYRGAYLTWGGGYDQFCVLANSAGDALLIWVPGTPSYESGSNGRCVYRGRVSVNGADLQTEPPTPIQPTKTVPTGPSTTSNPGSGPTTNPVPTKPNPAVIAAVAAAAAAYSKASSAVSSYAANPTNSAMADNADSTIDTAIASAQDAQSVANDQQAPNVATDLSSLSDTLFDAAARAAIALTLLSAAAASALSTALGPAAAAVAAAQAKAQDPSQNPSPTSSPPPTSTSSTSSTPFTCTICIACDDANLDGEPTTSDDAPDINENKRDLGQQDWQKQDLDERTIDMIYEDILGNGLANVESFLRERNITRPDPSILLEDFDLDLNVDRNVEFDQADWDLVMRNLEENIGADFIEDELEERVALAGSGRGMLCSSMFDVPYYDSWSSTGTNTYSYFYNYVQPGPNCQARSAVPLDILSARTSSGFPIPNGYQVANTRYATEHIYEIQQIAQFFNWASQNDNFLKAQGSFCATTGLGYLMKTKPVGGSPPWSTYSDFDYTIAPIQNFFNQLPGAGGARSEFVYLESKTNGVKGVLFNQARKPRVLGSTSGQVPQAARIVAVGKYLQDSRIYSIYKLVSSRIRETVDDFETACKQATDSRFAKYANVDFVGLYDTWERQFLSSITSRMKLQAKLNADLAYITAKRQAARGSTQARMAYRNLAKKIKVISQGINVINANSLTRPTAAPTRRN